MCLPNRTRIIPVKATSVRIYDISRPLNAALPVWPGDEPFRYTRSWRIADGASVNLGSISLSVHAGSHADAPVHFRDDGAAISELDLNAFIGPATLIDVSGLDPIRVEDIDLPEIAAAQRLLLRTGAWPDPAVFPERFPVIADGVPDVLGSRGIVLLGLDTPSVDRFDSTTLPDHHVLHRNGIHILESLCLTDVPPGGYELIALPLKLDGADGSPVRAILRDCRGPGVEEAQAVPLQSPTVSQ